MKNKGTVIAVSALAVLVAGVLWWWISSKPGNDRTESRQTVSSPSRDLLKAVPSDAAVVFCFDGSRQARHLLADSTGLLQPLIVPDGNPGVMHYLSAAGSSRMSVSLHNSGALVPLVVTACSPADTARLYPAAAAAGMKALYDRESGLLLSSRSETLVNTAVRHLREGYSVLDAEGFVPALDRGGKGCFVMATTLYAPKIFQVYAAPDRRKAASRARNLSRWNILSFESMTKDKVRLSGSASTSGVHYMDVFLRQGEAPVQFAEMLPYTVLSARSVHISDLPAYLEDYARYADAALGARTLDDGWVRKAAVSEVAIAELEVDGRTERVTLLLPGRDMKLSKGIRPNPVGKGLASCFGDAFAAPEDTLCLQVGKWLVLGPEPVLKAYSEKLFLKYSLKQFLSDTGASLPGGSGLVFYAAAGTGFLENTFSKSVSSAWRNYLGDVPFGPLLAYAGAEGGLPAEGISFHKGKALPEGGAAAVRDSVVVVPEGPFPVLNAETGKENKLYQNRYLSICLQDENGKDLWGIPFKERFCGRVASVDYYGNGRLQYLFAAGSQLYLIDRRGRFVTGFPVGLGKEVLLGPDLFDATGEGDYRVFVLHRDNTIEQYNLRGERPEGWMTMTTADFFKDLPQAAEVSGKPYWIVRTSGGPAVYNYDGGAPLPGKEAGKILKRVKIQ